MLSDYLERIYAEKMSFYRDVYKNSPRWLGRTSLKDKIIIIYCEQGFGDIFQFIRYIPSIKEHGCKVILHCPKELHNILKYCDIDEFLDKDCNNLPSHDYHILSMSIPFVVQEKEIEFPYINYPHKANLSEFVNDFKIGIAWEGNPDHSNNYERNCPLYNFKFLTKHAKLFMLQKQINIPEYSADCEDLELHSIEITDFTDTASLINSLNLVISVDTSVLHLAGAMNKRTIALLSFQHDPRWKIRDWYKSVSFIKQDKKYNWESVFRQLSEQMPKFSAIFNR